MPGAAAFRYSPREQARIAALFNLIPERGGTALDIGARDGFLSVRLSQRYETVIACDLEKPASVPPSLAWVVGDAARLPFPDRAFDLVMCVEVLEHIPERLLRRVCAELTRVTRRNLIIGVPYDQDLRLGRTTCATCGGKNPPYGHVNVFNELNLECLFPELRAEKTELVGESQERTNGVSARLYDWAANPYGTYEQDEPCIHCGAKLVRPAQRSLPQRAFAFAATHLQRAQVAVTGRRSNWMHVLYSVDPSR
ncbi:MAG: class I SAM-dependent methyltransferase [Fibrobacteres bacterium]|nr:class I SAM-dependent methyltransferase [Fibrobacterota bacterium]